jgi:RNA-directed DNA polymerase
MSEGKVAESKGENPRATTVSGQRNCPAAAVGATNTPVIREKPYPKCEQLMFAVVERKNLIKALQRVERNKGAPGVDKMPVEDLRGYLKLHWVRIKEELLNGTYRPQPVKRVEIPKPGGGVRKLGIPTVVDRFIQQAIHQALIPVFEPTFSENSYGFRPGRSAHQAVQRAQGFVAEGRKWVVDTDLEKFFDRVNHDVLMSRVARRVADKKLLLLIRRYLQSGIMDNGVETASLEGTPQGGPLSPLLSNIMLDELDKELERRGHCFCRYADDCNVYVKSKASGERVMESMKRFLRLRLKLNVNEAKSRVGRPWNRKFLGYSITWDRKPRLRTARESVKRLKGNLRQVFRAGRGRNLSVLIQETLNPKLRGWANYFHLNEVKSLFPEIDGWIRRRLRSILWRQWKRPATRERKLIERGFTRERAWKSASNGRGAWWNSGAFHMKDAFPLTYFIHLGLVSLEQQQRKLNSGMNRRIRNRTYGGVGGRGA